MTAVVAAAPRAGAREVAREPGRRVWPIAVRWGGTLLLVAGVLAVVDFRKVLALFTATEWELLLAALAVAVLERVLSTFRWWMLIRAKGLNVGFGSLVGLHMAASFAGSFLPTTVGADAVRIALLSRRAGRTIDCIAASAVDRMMMVLGTLLAAALAVVAAGALSSTLRWYVLGIAAVACAGTAIAASRSLMRPMGAVAARLFGRSVTEKLSKLYLGMYEYRGRHAVLAASAIVTALVLLVRVGYTWLIARALGVDVPLPGLLCVLPIAAAATMLPISVGGLGLQEGVFVVLLGAIGVSPAAAVSISLAEQVLSRLATAPGAAVLGVRGRPHTVELRDACGASAPEGELR